ncbi:predicted protein [Streptomyces albidoflavus]|nr:predicted protein [Streptomyces albidoflavus]
MAETAGKMGTSWQPSLIDGTQCQCQSLRIAAPGSWSTSAQLADRAQRMPSPNSQETPCPPPL